MPAEAQDQNWEDVSKNALKTLVDIQSMIDIMSERLVALRDLRLQEFIKQEIRSLEGKLIKHFWRQLSTKCEVPEVHWSSSFQTYPSLSQLLTVVGVRNDVNKRLTNSKYSVESLLELSQHEIAEILQEAGGDCEDERKLLAALRFLKGFDERQTVGHNDAENTFWDSWSKISPNVHRNGVDRMHDETERDHQPISEVDYNENFRQVGENFTKNSSSDIASNNNRHEILVHTTSGRTAVPSWNDRGDPDLQNQIPPPSPSRSSRSSMSSCGPPSPSYGSKLYGFPQSQLGPGTHTPPATMYAPSYMRHYAQEYANAQKTHSGQSSLTNTPPTVRPAKCQEPGRSTSTSNANHNLLLPFGPMRNARSSEWQIGNHITAVSDDNMTNSNVSLTSINTLPPPSTAGSSGTKLFSTGKKRNKKRPGNIVIQGHDPPDLIDLLKTGRRRSSRSQSTTISLDNDYGESPMSPGTPMTPVLPFNTDMWSRHKDITSSPAVPQTPKTPHKFRVGLRAIKDKIKDKIGYRSNKLRRNKSEERVADDDIAPSHHKSRSETYPSISVPGSILAHDQTAGQRHQADDSIQNSTHSSSSSLSSSHLVRMYNEPATFDAEQILASGMTTPGGASMLASRDNFGFDPYSERSSNLSFIGTDNTLVGDEQDMSNTVTSIYPQDNEPDDEFNEEDDDDLEEGELEHKRRANLMRQTSTTSTMQEEWDIPWDDLQLKECIGQGRVGAVFKGLWHGVVAIRVIEILHNDEFKLRAFKHEVMLYKMTRHENLELFMGSCMSPTRLAIVTGFCKGKSLHQYIRASRDQQVNLNQAKIIAQHIVQGMGYLHSKNIIHKDLKTKNIFIDGKRVVVTDFGLMGLHAISSRTMKIKPQTLQIPDGWLCYMAPEVIRSLQVPYGDIDVVSSLPYTKESDVYAFGTVWYELLAGCWPFKDYQAESIIWQVGNGKKQSLAHLQGSKELKDILMACWAYDPGQRPGYQDKTIKGIMEQLIRLPQAKIIRRSSQPIKGNKKGGRLGVLVGHDRLFDPLHELAE